MAYPPIRPGLDGEPLRVRSEFVGLRYAWYRSLGLFAGSGVVEAGCKSVIGQRLKLPGMRWTEQGATGIRTLRSLEASNRWDETWPPRNQASAA